jgi:cellulose synthase/poly-beta-1,6-N-acetylglucosamine synthase-like glycosyltransferase
VAVVIPCYNEGPLVYESIKSVAMSEYPKGKIMIFPQDDGSVDDSYQYMLKAAAEFPDIVFPERNEKNLGKTNTYLRAAERGKGSEIVMIVDSDSTVAPNAIAKMMACFNDSRIGVVGAPAGISNPHHNMLTAIQVYLYIFGIRLIKIPESHFLGVAVVGGYAFAVRRVVLEELADEIRNRNWFGVPVKDGEDRFVTHLALLRGWGTYVEQDAEVRTTAMETYPKYFGQQLRWRRSLIRTFFWFVRTYPTQCKTMNPAGAWSLISSGIAVLVLLLAMVFLVVTNPLGLFAATKLIPAIFLLATVMVGCSLVPHLKDQVVNNPAKLILFFSWWIVNNFWLVVLSFFTLDQDAWGNRAIKKTGADK